jgi:hypothetical protein
MLSPPAVKCAKVAGKVVHSTAGQELSISVVAGEDIVRIVKIDQTNIGVNKIIYVVHCRGDLLFESEYIQSYNHWIVVGGAVGIRRVKQVLRGALKGGVIVNQSGSSALMCPEFDVTMFSS